MSLNGNWNEWNGQIPDAFFRLGYQESEKEHEFSKILRIINIQSVWLTPQKRIPEIQRRDSKSLINEEIHEKRNKSVT